MKIVYRQFLEECIGVVEMLITFTGKSRYDISPKTEVRNFSSKRGYQLFEFACTIVSVHAFKYVIVATL